jgi:hypothetical protein
MRYSNLFLFFLFVPFITHAQNKAQSKIDSISNDLLELISSLDKEKILLQTNRHIYASGETIYFKAFLVDSITNHLRGKPKKLYADLVNNHDKVLGQLLLNASNLKTSGQFVLNDSLREGYYWIRAYTEKMVSENPGNITVVPVYVVNPRKRSFESEMQGKGDIDSSSMPIVQIFPEGGNIISGINSTVAVKVTNKRGDPLLVEGIVEDNTGSVVSKFSTNAHGLAKFSFYPIWYHHYSIHLSNVSVAALPAINFFSAQLAVLQQSDSNVRVRIALEDSIYSKDYATYVLSLSGDSVCYSAVGKGMYELDIPLYNFPHGVSRLLLFNTKKQLLSERDIYVKKDNYHISINTDKDNYGPRENVKVDIRVTNKNNKPLLAALSFAVTDAAISDTMIDYWTSDTLKHFSAEDADLVMLADKSEYPKWTVMDTLTGSKTRSDFEKIAFEVAAGSIDSNSSFIISGKVVNTKNQPVAKKLVTIFSNKNYMFLNTDTTDLNGRFKFYVPDYSNGTQFLAQVSNMKGKKEDEYKIIYDSVSMPHFITPDYLKKEFTLDEKSKAIINELHHIDSIPIGTGKELLKTVIINRRKKPEADYDETKRVSTFSHIITPEMLDRGANLAGNALLMIPGIHSTGRSIAIGGPSDIFGSMSEPLVVVDGVPIDSMVYGGGGVLGFVNSIPVSTIDFIEVLTGPESAIYGMQGGSGVILINTRSAPRKNDKDLTGLSSFYPKGFDAPHPSIMPDYNNRETKDSKMPDLRRTIYWNGNIITNQDGKASTSFFTADIPTTYLITITGISVNGDKIYKTVTISRK